MAANKFATMLQRNTHKGIVLLVYALLEWVLILLLLLNSFFAYLIGKFADYFGLKPPCSWCSSINHYLEPNKKKNYCRDLVCEAHAKEISNLRYCLNHQKLAESGRFCSDCSSPQPPCRGRNAVEISYLTWRGEVTSANGEKEYRCSCCDEDLTITQHPPYLLVKPPSYIHEYTQKGYSILETEEDAKSTSKSSNSAECGCDHNHKIKQIEEFSMQVLNFRSDAHEDSEFDNSEIVAAQEREFCHDRSLDESSVTRTVKYHHEFDPLIPIDLIDFSTISRLNSSVVTEEDVRDKHEELDEKFVSKQRILTEVDLIRVNDSVSDVALGMAVNEGEVQARDRTLEIGKSSTLMAESKIQCLVYNAQAPCTNDTVSEEWIIGNETLSTHATIVNEGEVLTRSRVPEIGNSSMLTAEPNFQDLVFNAQAPSTNDVETATKEQPAAFKEDDACKLQPDETASESVFVEETSSPDPTRITRPKEVSFDVDSNEEINLHIGKSLEAKETEEDNFPLAQTRADDLHQLDRKQMKDREKVAEGSWNGSEMEANDGIERLKAELEAERKALSSLYTELEEERSAAAVAASQTMAMITRLQEEKAAMQMEALQYQRMMDEQSEYDQEALQLLNELMVKREKEKQELEKELEMYRKKVNEGERMKLTRRTSGSVRSRCSSACCSNAEDNEELFNEPDCEVREEEEEDDDDDILGLNDCVKHLGTLEESVKEFEEERLSILDELKELEEKLFTLVDNEEHMFEQSPSANFGEKHSLSSREENENENENANGTFEESNGGKTKFPDIKARKLLPLFDDATTNGEDEQNDQEVVDRSSRKSLAAYEMEKRDGRIEEDIGRVYERLQALEADREFLKHCMSSLKKGDKGMDLLQEILQHLRDLKAVETQVRNIADHSPFTGF